MALPPQTQSSFLIRKAAAADAVHIAGFNSAMALETEGKRLDSAAALAGAQRLIADPALGFYVVAQHGEKVAAALMITTEWSDWRNAVFWWIQSVYVLPEFRRAGAFRALYSFVREQAEQNGGVCGIRLYVEKDNSAAQATYRGLGMEQPGYLVFQQLSEGFDF